MEVRGPSEGKGVVEDWLDALRKSISGGRAAGKGKENVASREAVLEPADLSLIFCYVAFSPWGLGFKIQQRQHVA